jgi:two-component system NarL family sensor kinase
LINPKADMKLPTLIFFLCFFMACHLSIFAQDNADSIALVRALEQGEADSVILHHYNTVLRSYYYAYRLEEMLDKSSEMRALFEKKEYLPGIASALFYKASALELLGKGDEAIPLLDQSIEIYYSIKDTLLAAKPLLNKGVALQRKGESDLALEAYLKVYQIFSRYKEKNKLSRVLNNIAIIYRNQDKYDKALEAYEESLKLKKEINDSTGIAVTSMNIGIFYSYIDEMETALTYLHEAQSLYEELGATASIAECNGALGAIYYNLGCPQEAKEPLMKANAYYKQHPFPWSQSAVSFSLGSIALNEEDYLGAEKYFTESIAYSKEANRWGDRLEIYLKYSQAKYALGKNKEAYEALKIAYELQDSIKEERRLALTEESQAKFEVLQKEKALAINKLALEKSNLQRNSLIGGMILLLMLGIGLLLFFRQRIRIARQKAALQQQRIQQLEQEKQLAALNALVEGEEKERLRIATDLHDGMGGLLTAVKSHFTQLFNPPVKEGLFDKTSSLIDEACAEVRRIAHNMAPRALAISGLTGALEDLCVLLRQQGLDCELEILGLEEEKLQEQSVSIYRIIQELSNNVLKHASARHLLIQLFQKNNNLSILVEDDGKGFEYKEASTMNGLGLSSITSRVKILKGDIDWDSVIGEGTTVNISIPVG